MIFRRARESFIECLARDKVWARDTKTGKNELRTVTAIAAQHRDKLVELRVEGEHAPLHPTPTHPFWVKRNAGEAAHWIDAGDLVAGEQIETEDGRWVTVESVQPLNGLAVVYNFTVEGDHDYFVGESGLLVHNTVCDLQLKYKPGWTPNQIASADTKVAALNDANTVVTDVQRSGTSASRIYQATGGTIPPGSDIDHIIDLQLGGAYEASNMAPLDLSVNRSLGAQIAQQIADLPIGTVIRYVTIGW